MGKKGEHQEHPRRRLPDATPCWCLDEPGERGDGTYTHSPRCLTLRALQGGYDFADTSGGERPRRAATTRAKKAAYLRNYATTGRIMESAYKAGVDPSSVKRWRGEDDGFVEAEGAAHDVFVEWLESVAIKRATEGVAKPVFQGGQQVGTTQEFSDVLLIFLMKGERPGKYRDQAKIELTGPGGGPLRHTVSALASMDDHERAALRRVIDQALSDAQTGTEAKEEATETTPA